MYGSKFNFSPLRPAPRFVGTFDIDLIPHPTVSGDTPKYVDIVFTDLASQQVALHSATIGIMSGSADQTVFASKKALAEAISSIQVSDNPGIVEEAVLFQNWRETIQKSILGLKTFKPQVQYLPNKPEKPWIMGLRVKLKNGKAGKLMGGQSTHNSPMLNITPNPPHAQACLSLMRVLKKLWQNALGLLGVSTPERL